jgi:sporulation protein YunB
MRRRRRKILALLIPFSLLFCLAALLRTRIDPLTQELALAQVSDLASNLINDAVNQEISQGNVQYDDLITLQWDNSGNLTALTANMQQMNLLKTKLLQLLDQDLHSVDDDLVSIPLGNLTGVQLLSGRGPQLPVKIVSVASSDASFHGEFSDAGINQTIHRIVLEVSLDLVILLPSGTVTDYVSSEVCVAETVLLGPVPESYTYFNSTGGETTTKYFASE